MKNNKTKVLAAGLLVACVATAAHATVHYWPLVKDARAGNRQAAQRVLQAARNSAELGFPANAGTEYYAGLLYDNGWGVPRNYYEAVYWYEKAAKQGDATAEYNLGVAYQHGQGVRRDYALANAWYRKAAEQGNAAAETSLGVAYFYGQGVPKNYAKAAYWWKKSAAQGNANAENNLGFEYQHGQGMPRSYLLAAYWYEKAAEQGDVRAENNLANLRNDVGRAAGNAGTPARRSDSVERFAAAGGAVVPVVHDVVPLTHPAYFPHFTIRPFAQGLTRILRVACGILTVSRAVMSDVGNYCAEQGYGHLPLDYAYSGADIVQPVVSEMTSVRPAIVAQCQTRPFLMVGTVEPRKGYLTALDAYELYQKAGGRRPLVIVGRLGWKELDIVARVQAVASSSGSVHFYHDASDAELAALYQHAGALIFASHYEGFGLPLVEAMHQGLPVIASDIPVFQEIGGDYPAYFHVGSAEDLCRAMQGHDRAEGDRRKPPRSWPTWDEAAPGYIDKAIALYQTAP